MPALSHVGLGLAAKRATPRISVFVLVIATLALDILAGVFWLAGIVGIIPTDNLAWSHSLLMSVFWSVIAAMLAARLYRNVRASAVIGLLVFSHWLLDFMLWPPNASLLYQGGPEIGLDLGKPIGVAIAFELGVLILGIVIYVRSRGTTQQT